MDWGETLATYLGNARDVVLGKLRDRDTDIAKGLDPAVVTVTNPPLNMIRWNSANRKNEKYNGTSWVDLIDYFDIEIKAFTGDVTKAAGDSALTIGANKVLDTMLRDSAALSVIGRAANTSGDPADIVAAADDRLLTRLGAVLGWTQLTVGMFPVNVITNAKLAQVATQTFKGRNTIATGDPEDLTIATAKAMLGITGISAAGTRVLFHQTAAPTGWAKETNAVYNDAALRIVTGTVGTGGADAFSTHFGTGKVTGTGTSGGFTLTMAEIPGHVHNVGYANPASGGSTIPAVTTTGGAPISNINTDSAGGGGAHAHSVPALTLPNFNIKFVDCVICQKD